MKTSIKILLLTVPTIALIGLMGAISGCGSSSSNTSAADDLICGSTGCYYGTDGYGSYGYSPNAVMYMAQSPITITNGALWDQFMEGDGGCDTMFDSCYGLGNPYLQLYLYDDTFSEGTGSSPGEIAFTTGAAYGTADMLTPITTSFREVNNNSGFAAIVYSGPTTSGILGGVNSTGGTLQITVNGSPTAAIGSTASVQFEYNGSLIGEGTVIRVE